MTLARLYATETRGARERPIDAPGQVLAVASLAVLVGATIEGGVRGFGSAPVLAGFALAVASLLGFVIVEARRREPMLPLSLFSARAFSVSAVIGLLVNLLVYGLIFLFSLYFQTVQRHTPLATGLLLVPYVIAAGLGNVISARMARHLGPVRAPLVSATLLGAASLGLVWIGSSTPYPAIVAQLVCLGAGLRHDRPGHHLGADGIGRAQPLGRGCRDAQHDATDRLGDRRGVVRLAAVGRRRLRRWAAPGALHQCRDGGRDGGALHLDGALSVAAVLCPRLGWRQCLTPAR